MKTTHLSAPCIASKRLSVNPLGMLLCDPDGWTALVGDETQDQLDDPSTFEVVALPQILESNPELDPFVATASPGDWAERESIGSGWTYHRGE